MSAWAEEIRRLPTGDCNRSIEWCAEELQRATAALLFEYLRFLDNLRWRRRRDGHRWNFACCKAVKARRAA